MDLLKKLGLNVVEIASSDWSTAVARRSSKKPVEEGGWSIVPTSFAGAETLDPSANLPSLARERRRIAWFGWPSDEQLLEALRTQWMRAADEATRKDIAAKIQVRAFEVVPYVPLGQWWPMTAYRKSVKGVMVAPAEFMWNIEKA